MTLKEDVFYKCLSLGIQGKKVVLNQEESKVHLEEMTNLAKVHDVVALFYSSISNTNYIKNQPKEEVNRLKKMVFLNSLYQKRFMIVIKDILESLNEAEIEVIVLKGFILRRYYPVQEYRTMGDVDLIVDQKNLNKAREILIKEGWIEGDITEVNIDFTKDNFKIELHWNLISDKKLVTENTFDKGIWDNKKKADSNLRMIYMMNKEDTLIYMLTHMAKHMKNQGFGVRALCDLYLYLKVESDNMDWEYVKKNLNNGNLLRFSDIVFKLCNLLFNMEDYHDLFEGEDIKEKELLYLGRRILRMGVHGKEDKVGNISKRSTNLIFQPIDLIQENYSYVNKFRPLIVIAWIHRLLKILIKREFKFKEKIILLIRHKDMNKSEKEFIRWLGL